MKKQTAMVLVAIAVLMVLTAVYTRGEGGGVLGRWLAALHGNANAGH
jgi:hypothetical protein